MQHKRNLLSFGVEVGGGKCTLLWEQEETLSEISFQFIHLHSQTCTEVSMVRKLLPSLTFLVLSLSLSLWNKPGLDSNSRPALLIEVLQVKHITHSVENHTALPRQWLLLHCTHSSASSLGNTVYDSKWQKWCEIQGNDWSVKSMQSWNIINELS